MPGSDSDECHQALLSASIARSWYKTSAWLVCLVGERLPDRNGCLSERVVTGQLLAGEAALDPLLHAFGQLAGLHQIQIQRLNVAEVEEVSLPFDLGVGIETEPAAADAVDLGLRVVRVGDDLLPEADDLALLVVDDDFLVRVLPVLEALHLEAVDRGLRVVRVGDDLLPEADDLALLVVDDDFLVRVLPVLEALHLQAEGDIANQ